MGGCTICEPSTLPADSLSAFMALCISLCLLPSPCATCALSLSHQESSWMATGVGGLQKAFLPSRKMCQALSVGDREASAQVLAFKVWI